MTAITITDLENASEFVARHIGISSFDSYPF